MSDPLVDAISTCFTGLLATGKGYWNDAEQRYDVTIDADAMAESVAALFEPVVWHWARDGDWHDTCNPRCATVYRLKGDK